MVFLENNNVVLSNNKEVLNWQRENEWCLEAWVGNAAEVPAIGNGSRAQQFIILFQFICLGVILGILKYGGYRIQTLSCREVILEKCKPKLQLLCWDP